MRWASVIILVYLLGGSVQAQTDSDQPATPKTIPVMRSGVTVPQQSDTTPVAQAPAGSAPAASPSTPHLIITKPVPESEIQPKSLPTKPNPADEAIRKDADDAITTQADAVSDACDTAIKARIDWTTISAQDINQNSPANSCGAALDAIQEMCQSSAGRERVGAIKSLICTAGPQPAVSLRGSTLIYTLDWQSRQPGAFVYSWLATHL